MEGRRIFLFFKACVAENIWQNNYLEKHILVCFDLPPQPNKITSEEKRTEATGGERAEQWDCTQNLLNWEANCGFKFKKYWPYA